MKLSRIKQRHNRNHGQSHNSPRLEHVLKDLIAWHHWHKAWPFFEVLPKDFGRSILYAMRVDPYDVLTSLPAPQGRCRGSYIRGDIRHRSFYLFLQELMVLMFVLLMLMLFV